MGATQAEGPEHTPSLEEQMSPREREYYAAQDQESKFISNRMQPFHSMLEGGITNEQLGALVREYVLETEHGSWEGFSFLEQFGVAAFLADMARYREHSK